MEPTASLGADRRGRDEQRHAGRNRLARNVVRAVPERHAGHHHEKEEKNGKRPESPPERERNGADSQQDPAGVQKQEAAVLGRAQSPVRKHRAQIGEVAGLGQVRGIFGQIRDPARGDPVADEVEVLPGRRHARIRSRSAAEIEQREGSVDEERDQGDGSHSSRIRVHRTPSWAHQSSEPEAIPEAGESSSLPPRRVGAVQGRGMTGKIRKCASS